MKTIRLYGALAKKFGETHVLDIKSPAEAVRALSALKPGFRGAVERGKFHFFTSRKNGRGRPVQYETLSFPLSRADTLHIAPSGHSAGIEVGTAILIGTLVMAAAAVAVAIFAPLPSAVDPNDREIADRASAIADGAEQRTSQGHVAPVIFGEVVTGSIVVSSGVQIAEETQTSFGTGDGTAGVQVGEGGTRFWTELLFSKGGKGGGGQARAAQEDPNTLQSNAIVRTIEVIGVGHNEGLVDGLKSVAMDGTPVENEDGSTNFPGFAIDVRNGNVNQSYIEGFPGLEASFQKGLQITNAGGGIVHTITDEDIDSARVAFRIPSLFKQDTTNGDLKFHKVICDIEIQSDGGGYTSIFGNSKAIFDGKCTSPYQREYIVSLPAGGAPWDIRVSRVSGDTPEASIQDDTYFDFITEVTDVKLNWPGIAHVGLTANLKQFGTQVKKRSYHWRGLHIQVPSNFDPVARTYTGVWDGTFKTAYSDDPAWCLYALATNEFYGGGKLTKGMVDKWAFYAASVYCNEQVPDGMGGTEPRFRLSAIIQTRMQAIKLFNQVAAVFRGAAVWGSDGLTVLQDRPELDEDKPVIVPANTGVDKLTYDENDSSEEFSQVIVWWNDIEENGELRPHIEKDNKLLQKLGFEAKEVTAWGAASKGQAARAGRWLLEDQKYKKRRANLPVGPDQSFTMPGKVVKVHDDRETQNSMGGRLAGATTTTLTLDRVVTLESGQTYTVNVIMPDGTTEIRTVQSEATTVVPDGDDYSVLTVTAAFSTVPVINGIWALESDQLALQQFRVEGSTEKDMGHILRLRAYDPNSYARVEQEIDIAPETYSDLTTSFIKPITSGSISVLEYQKIDGDSSVPSARISWSLASDPRVVGYDVEIRSADSDGYDRIVGTEENGRDIVGILPGDVSIRVRAYDSLGRPSSWEEQDFTLTGGTSAIPNVTGLSVSVDHEALISRLSWTAPSDVRPLEYEILHHSSVDFGSAVSIGKTKQTEFVVSRLGVFWVRARYMDTVADAPPYVQVTAAEAPKPEWTAVSGRPSNLADLDATADAAITQLEADLADAEGRIDQAELDISGVASDLAQAELALAQADADLNTAIAGVASDLADAEVALNNSISAVASDLADAETILQGNIDTVSNAVDQAQLDITAAEGRLDDVEPIVASHTSSITQLTDATEGNALDISSLEAFQTSAEGDIASLQTSASNLESRLSTVEGDYATSTSLSNLEVEVRAKSQNANQIRNSEFTTTSGYWYLNTNVSGTKSLTYDVTVSGLSRAIQSADSVPDLQQLGLAGGGSNHIAVEPGDRIEVSAYFAAVSGFDTAQVMAFWQDENNVFDGASGGSWINISGYNGSNTLEDFLRVETFLTVPSGVYSFAPVFRLVNNTGSAVSNALGYITRPFAAVVKDANQTGFSPWTPTFEGEEGADVTENSTYAQNLNSRLATVEGDYATSTSLDLLQSQVTGISDDLDAAEGNIAQASADISSLQTTKADLTALEAEALRIDDLNADVYDPATGLSTKASLTYVDGVIANESSARATEISSLRLSLYNNVNSTLPDEGFYDEEFWNFASGVSGADSDSAWFSNRVIEFPTNWSGSMTSDYFPVDLGATYKITGRIWVGSGFSGYFQPLIHIPNVRWYSIFHDDAVDATVTISNATSADAIVAPVDTDEFELIYTNPISPVHKNNRRWQVRFRGDFTGGGVAVALRIEKLGQYAEIEALETTTANLDANKADISVTNALNVSVGNLEDTVTDHADDIGSLQTEASNIDSRLSFVEGDYATATNLSLLQSEVTGISDDLDAAELNIAQASSDITSLQQTKADLSALQAEATRIDDLNADVYDPSTGLSTKASTTYVDSAVAGEASARSTAVSNLQSQIDDNVDDIGGLQTTASNIDNRLSFVEGDYATSQNLSNLESSFDNLRIGGTNIVRKEDYLNTVTVSTNTNSGWGLTVNRVSGANGLQQSKAIAWPKGVDITLSFVAWINSGDAANTLRTDLWPDTLPETSFSIDTTPTLYSVTFNSSHADMDSARNRFWIPNGGDTNATITDIQWEIGNRYTSWSPAPNDVEALRLAGFTGELDADRTENSSYAQNLNFRLATVEGDYATATNLSLLQSQVTGISDDLDDAELAISQANSAITSLETTKADLTALEAEALRIDDLVAEIEDPSTGLSSKAAITYVDQLDSDQTQALAEAVTDISTQFDLKITPAPYANPDLSERIVLHVDTAKIAAYEDGTDIYIDDVLETTLNRGQTYETASLSAGTSLWSDKPANFHSRAGYAMASVGSVGNTFMFRQTRYYPQVLKMYSPLGEAEVEIYRNKKVDGVPSYTVTIPQGVVTTWTDPVTETSGTYDWRLNVKGGGILVAKSGTGGDYELLRPASTIALGMGATALDMLAWTDTSDVTTYDGGRVVISDEPTAYMRAGDGAGSDSDTSLSPADLGDTYVTPFPDLEDYYVQAIEPCVVKVYDKNGTEVGEEDLSAGSLTSPAYIQRGNASGTGGLGWTDGPYYFVGSAPFFLRSNDPGTDREYAASGFRAAEWGRVSASARKSSYTNARIVAAFQAVSDEESARTTAIQQVVSDYELADSNLSSSITNLEETVSTGVNSHASRLTALETTVDDPTVGLSAKMIVVEDAVADLETDKASVSSVSSLEAELRSTSRSANILHNAEFTVTSGYWYLNSNMTSGRTLTFDETSAGLSRAVYSADSVANNSQIGMAGGSHNVFACQPGDRIEISAYFGASSGWTHGRVLVFWYNNAGGFSSASGGTAVSVSGYTGANTLEDFVRIGDFFTVPANVYGFAPVYRLQNNSGSTVTNAVGYCVQPFAAFASAEQTGLSPWSSTYEGELGADVTENSSYAQNLNSRLTTVEGDYATATDFNALEAIVSDPTTGLEAIVNSQSTAISNLETGKAEASDLTLLRLSLYQTSNSVIPDSGFYDDDFWNFTGGAAGADSSSGWTQRRLIEFPANWTGDFLSDWFDVEPGATYRIKTRIWRDASFSGWFQPLIHVPNVRWHSLFHNDAVAVDDTSASGSVTTSGDTDDLEHIYTNPVSPTHTNNRRWQFRFNGSYTGGGIAVAVSIEKVLQYSEVSALQTTVGELSTDKAEVTTVNAINARLENAEATVLEHTGAITTLEGRTQAWWEVDVSAGSGADAFILASAENVSGTPYSTVGIGGRSVILYSLTEDDWFAAVYIEGTTVKLAGDLEVGSSIVVGEARWPVGLGSVKYAKADGESETFAADLGVTPDFDFDTKDLAPLGAGETYSVKVTSASSLGFTAYAKIVTPSSTATQTNTTDAAGSGSDPERVMTKPTAADAYDSSYTFVISGTLNAISSYDSDFGVWTHFAGQTIEIYANDGAGWDSMATVGIDLTDAGYQNNYPGDLTGNHTWQKSVTITYGDAIGNSATYEFGATEILDVTGSSSLDDLDSVTYQTQTQSGVVTASPNGEKLGIKVTPKNVVTA